MKEENKNIEFLIELGKKIKLLRLQSNLSQEKFSFDCNLHRTYIGAVERGEKNISISNLKKIADTLNISLSELLNFKNIL